MIFYILSYIYITDKYDNIILCIYSNCVLFYYVIFLFIILFNVVLVCISTILYAAFAWDASGAPD